MAVSMNDFGRKKRAAIVFVIALAVMLLLASGFVYYLLRTQTR